MKNEIETQKSNEINKTDTKLHLVRRCHRCSLVKDTPEELKNDICPLYNPNKNMDYCPLDLKSRTIKTPEKMVEHVNFIIADSYKNIEGLKQQMAHAGVGFSEQYQKALESHVKLLKDLKEFLSTQNEITVHAKGKPAGILSEIFSAKSKGNS